VNDETLAHWGLLYKREREREREGKKKKRKKRKEERRRRREKINHLINELHDRDPPHEKLIVAYLVEKFLAFYETSGYIIMFLRACH
jgi:hypothetical protein